MNVCIEKINKLAECKCLQYMEGSRRTLWSMWVLQAIQTKQYVCPKIFLIIEWNSRAYTQFYTIYNFFLKLFHGFFSYVRVIPVFGTCTKISKNIIEDLTAHECTSSHPHSNLPLSISVAWNAPPPSLLWKSVWYLKFSILSSPFF